MCRSFGKSCTLYQLSNLIDRRDVSSDSKEKMHACQSFLTVDLEAEILAAFTASQNLTSLDSDIARIIKKCMPESTQGKLDCISQLALQVVKCTSLSKAASGGYL